MGRLQSVARVPGLLADRKGAKDRPRVDGEEARGRMAATGAHTQAKRIAVGYTTTAEKGRGAISTPKAANHGSPPDQGAEDPLRCDASIDQRGENEWNAGYACFKVEEFARAADTTRHDTLRTVRGNAVMA